MTVPLKATLLKWSGRMLLVETADNPQSVVDAMRYPGPAASSASFLGTDTTTQGTWIGHYGADGYDLPTGAKLPAPYEMSVLSGGVVFPFATGSSDPRATQTPDGSTRDIKCWYNVVPFSYTVNFQDAATHKVSIYFCDWDYAGRVMSVAVTDDVGGATLDTRDLTNFGDGVWLSWNCTGNVTFTFTATVGNAVVSGVFYDGGNPDNTTQPVLPLTYRVNGGAPQSPSGAIWFSSAAPDHPYRMPGALFLLPTALSASDSVTFSMPEKAYVTVNGASSDVSAATTDAPVANGIGQDHLPDALAGTHVMRVGWQDPPGAYFWPRPLYANLCKTAAGDWSDFWNVMARGVNANGYPTNETGVLQQPVLTKDVVALASGASYGPFQVGVPGQYNLVWDGTATPLIAPYDADTTVSLVSSTTPGTNNLRVYDVGVANGNPSPALMLQVDFSGGGQLSNLGLFDSYTTDPLNPTRFHPAALAQLAGARVFRTMPLFNIQASSVVDTWDYPQESWVGYAMSESRNILPVVRIEAYAPGQQWSRVSYEIKITFGQTHPFRAGQQVQIYAPDGSGSYTLLIPITYQDGTRPPPVVLSGLVYPLDATSVVMEAVIDNKAINTLDWSATPGISRITTGSAPMAVGVQIALDIGSDCAVWYNTAFATSDALATALGQMFATVIPAGDTRPIYHEHGNEPWNYSPDFKTYYHNVFMGLEFAQQRAAAGDPSWVNADQPTVAFWYEIMRSRKVFEGIEAAWVAAGRDPAQLNWVLNIQMASISQTTSALTFCANHDSDGRLPTEAGYSGPMVPSLIAVSPYFAPGQTNPAIPTATWDSLTVPMVADYVDVYCAYYQYTDQYAQAIGHKQAIQDAAVNLNVPAFANIRIAGYEGGPAKVTMGGTLDRMEKHTLAWNFHPCIHPQYQTFLREYETLGYEVFVDYDCGGDFCYESPYHKVYAAFVGMAQKPGKGDGSDGLTNNVALIQDASGNPVTFDPTAVVSVAGHTVQEWLSVASSLSLGSLSTVTVSTTSVQVRGPDATGGTGPYLYVWYRSTTAGFTPAPGDQVAGWTTPTPPADTGLTPGTTYYYRMSATDSATPPATVTTPQLQVTTTGGVSGSVIVLQLGSSYLVLTPGA